MLAITAGEPVQHLSQILMDQRAAFERDGAPSLADRRVNLARLRAAILERKADIAAAVSADFGHRSHHETAVMEVFTVIRGIDYLRRNLRRFMRPSRRHVAWTMRLSQAGSNISRSA
jgi:coniferyl-aldehyde dehydrogenase